MKTIIFISLCMLLFSCNNNSKMEIIELSNHTNVEKRNFSFLISNPPESIDSLIIKYYKRNSLQYYKIEKTNGTYFYIKDKETSYFINHSDEEAGVISPSHLLYDDYFYGDNGRGHSRHGLGGFICEQSKQNVKKYIFTIIRFDNMDKIWEFDTLRDEYTPNWYELHKDNELVRLFNEGEPFE